ncbi:hypothetical protein KAW18_02655 [candidate division WOR-3 bacterium]|nr:hypothetical protein [candidate division WOR-3 bacterium]
MTEYKEKEAHINDFMQLHNAIMKAVDKYMIEVEIPLLKAKYIYAPLCVIGMLFGAFLMFLACV